MAGFQQVPIPQQHKAIINEMKATINVKKPTITEKETVVQSEVYTKGLIRNYAPGEKIEYLGQHDWSGNVLGCYPPSIPKNLNQGFVHKGLQPIDYLGSKGAVIYAGKSNEEVKVYDIAWLLAWHVPLDGGENKVYVECGDINDYKDGKIGFDDIEMKLNSSTSYCFYKDNETGARVVIDIDNVGPIARLACLFYVDGHI